jgi:hypothetical protein
VCSVSKPKKGKKRKGAPKTKANGGAAGEEASKEVLDAEAPDTNGEASPTVRPPWFRGMGVNTEPYRMEISS